MLPMLISLRESKLFSNLSLAKVAWEINGLSLKLRIRSVAHLMLMFT